MAQSGILQKVCISGILIFVLDSSMFGFGHKRIVLKGHRGDGMRSESGPTISCLVMVWKEKCIGGGLH